MRPASRTRVSRWALEPCVCASTPILESQFIRRRVITVGISRDRSVPVDAATNEVTKPLVRYRERSEPETLLRHELEREKPVVEHAVAPLQPVTRVDVRICELC